MFEEIFSYPSVLRRHREGPLASERQDYLEYLKGRGAASGTVAMQARYCLAIAREIQQYRRDHCFKPQSPPFTICDSRPWRWSISARTSSRRRHCLVPIAVSPSSKPFPLPCPAIYPNGFRFRYNSAWR